MPHSYNSQHTMQHHPARLPPEAFTPYLNPHRPLAIKNHVRAEAGKAPWYDSTGNPHDAYLIGVAGASASGKSYVSKAILEGLPNVPWVAVISMDSFYRTLTPEQSQLAFQSKYDFDHPSAFDMDILFNVLHDIKRGRAVELPTYSFVHHQRQAHVVHMYGPSVVILEGIFALHDPQIRSLLDLKLYCQTDSDVMLARRIRRDMAERGRDLDGILAQYLRFVKPSFETYVAPTARFADLIVPGMNNEVAIHVITEHIRSQLDARACKLRLELAQASPQPALDQDEPSLPGEPSTPSPMPVVPTSPSTSPAPTLPPNVTLLRQTPQLRALLTLLHDRTTPSAAFVAACNRVAALVVEAALGVLPYRDKVVRVARPGVEEGAGQGGKSYEYVGKELDVRYLCSVSILRSGSVFEKALRRALPALTLGSLLIQSSQDGEPHLYTLALPSFLRTRALDPHAFVLLCDAQISSGAAAVMAIRVVLDHGVPQERIVFLALLASWVGGVWAVLRAFPRVRIIVAGMDPGLRKMRIALSEPPDVSSPPLGLSRARARVQDGAGAAVGLGSGSGSGSGSGPGTATATGTGAGSVPTLALPPSKLSGSPRMDGEGSTSTTTTAGTGTSTGTARRRTSLSPPPSSAPRANANAKANGSSTTTSLGALGVGLGSSSSSSWGRSQEVSRSETGPAGPGGMGIGMGMAGMAGMSNSKTVYAITPGMGSIGDRYYGTA